MTRRRFALLTLESFNRLYGYVAGELLAAELRAVADRLHATVGEVEQAVFGGVDYVVFAAVELDDHDRFVVSNLSGVRAVFEVTSDGALHPLELSPLAHFGSDLVTIQRYAGKTNEQFTHLLLNLTVAGSRAAAERSAQGLPIRVLDPVAGRGTTLNRALIYGYDTAGIEVASADADQYRTFISTYLKNHRVKHKLTDEKIRKGPLAGTDRFSIRLGTGQRVEFVHGDTELAGSMFPTRSFDAVVGDLPYGVQHRAAAGGARTRSPHELLASGLDGWRTLMRGGAAIGLAWNLKTLARTDVEGLMTDHGFEMVEHPASFEHVVDRSITRDLLVAIKP